MEGQIVAAEAAVAPPKRVRAPRKPKEAVVEPVAAPPGLEEPPSSDQPPRARSRTPRAPRTQAAAEPEPEMSPPPPKRARAPRKPKVAAAEVAGPADQMQVLLPVVDGAFLASLSGTLKTLRKQTRDERIASLQIA